MLELQHQQVNGIICRARGYASAYPFFRPHVYNARCRWRQCDWFRSRNRVCQGPLRRGFFGVRCALCRRQGSAGTIAGTCSVATKQNYQLELSFPGPSSEPLRTRAAKTAVRVPLRIRLDLSATEQDAISGEAPVRHDGGFCPLLGYKTTIIPREDSPQVTLSGRQSSYVSSSGIQTGRPASVMLVP